MTKKLIGFTIPDGSKQIVISKGKTMEEAVKFAKEMYGFDGENMEKIKNKENTRIGIMNRKIFKINKNGFDIN